jgi:uncharacterized membrane protein
MTVTTSRTTRTGTYSLTITGVNGTVTRSITVSLVITGTTDCGNC